MLAQFRYALWDISDGLGRFFVNLVQIIVSMLLIAFAILKIIEVSDFDDRMSMLDNLSNTYIMTDVTDEQYFSEEIMVDDSLESLKQFYSYLTESEDFTSYTSYTYLAMDGGEEGLFVNDEFLSAFNLKDSDGNTLSGIFSQDYGEYVPVILGSGYSSRYKVGDVIDGYADSKLKVVAFFESGSYYYKLTLGSDPISLDALAVCPAITYLAEQDIVYYLSAIEGSCIITEDPDVLTEISETSVSLGLSEYHFKSFKEQVDSMRESELESFQISMIVMILVLSLCTACMIASLLTFVEEHLREFAIHLLSGATVSTVIFRVLIQTGTPIVLANLIAGALYRDGFVSLWLLAVSVALFALITVVPVVKISLLGINGILKRCE